MHADYHQTQQDLSIAEGQLNDYRARVGTKFTHESYLARLTELRDQLRAGLSGSTPEEGPSVADLAEQIKTLKAGNTIEAAPERSEKRTVSAETPVSRRIMQKAEVTVNGDEEDGWQQRVA